MRKKAKTGSFLNRNARFVMTIPTIAFILICVVYPLFYTFRLSFFDWRMSANVAQEFVGLGNYVELFSPTADF